MEKSSVETELKRAVTEDTEAPVIKLFLTVVCAVKNKWGGKKNIAGKILPRQHDTLTWHWITCTKGISLLIFYLLLISYFSFKYMQVKEKQTLLCTFITVEGVSFQHTVLILQHLHWHQWDHNYPLSMDIHLGNSSCI